MTTVSYLSTGEKVVENEFGKFVYRELTRKPSMRQTRAKPRWTLVYSELKVTPTDPFKAR